MTFALAHTGRCEYNWECESYSDFDRIQSFWHLWILFDGDLLKYVKYESLHLRKLS